MRVTPIIARVAFRDDPSGSAPGRDQAHEVTSAERLNAVRETGLLDGPPQSSLDRYVRIASLALGTPVNLVSLVDANRQFFAAALGLADPWAQARQTPLSHSFCRHVVADAKPFLVTDARQDPRVAGNLAIDELNVTAYAGMPITAGSEDVVGSFCAIDSKPRVWTEREIALLSELAALVSQELEFRRKAQRVMQVEAQIAAIDEKLTPAGRVSPSQAEMIAHDLRTPLQTMSIVVSLFRSHPSLADSAQLRQLLDRLDRNLIQAGSMVDSLGQADPPRPHSDVTTVDVSSVLDMVCGDLYREEGKVSIQVQSGDGLHVSADEVGLRRCIYNLLTNAQRFAVSSIVVSSGRLDDVVSIVIEDDGPGLPASEDWAKVWEPGVTFHADDGRSNSGLGLAITRELITGFGGRISVSTSRLGGARFELQFPADCTAGTVRN